MRAELKLALLVAATVTVIGAVFYDATAVHRTGPQLMQGPITMGVCFSDAGSTDAAKNCNYVINISTTDGLRAPLMDWPGPTPCDCTNIGAIRRTFTGTNCYCTIDMWGCDAGANSVCQPEMKPYGPGYGRCMEFKWLALSNEEC